MHTHFNFILSCADNHSQRNNFHNAIANSLELTIGTAFSKSSSVSVTTSPQSTSSPHDAKFSYPKGTLKGQQSLEHRNSMLTVSTAPTTTTTAKMYKQPRKRRRSSVEQTSPVVNASKSNDVLVSPIPVDGLKDMPQPFVSPTDMGFHLGAIPATLPTLHQPVNHQMQDIKNYFGNDQHLPQQYNKDSHKSVTSEDNLNAMISKVHVPQCSIML